MEFRDVVRRRRMVRQFAAEPVDRSILERIAATAQRTPSAGFSQGQRLVIVTQPARMRRVADIAMEGEYVDAGFDPWLSRCAALFVPCVSEKVYRDRYDEPDKRPAGEPAIAWPVPYWWMDIGCTVMLILLAAVDEGLGAGFAGTLEPRRLNAELGIPDHFVPVGVIPVGRPLPDKRSPSLKRGWRPLDDFARWESWEGGQADPGALTQPSAAGIIPGVPTGPAHGSGLRSGVAQW